MPEVIPDEAAMVDPVAEPVTDPIVEPAEVEPLNEWEQKYQGQLKVNRDLEKKLDLERKAKAALELQNAPAEEQAAAKARAELTAEVNAKANARILRADLRALATGKLADPTDAALYIDLDNFTVTDDGETDSDALNEAIDELLVKKPHLAAGKVSRFDGVANQGAKSKDSKPRQLTDVDLLNMSPDEINTARRAGLLKDLGA